MNRDLQSKAEELLADLVAEVSELPRASLSPEADFQEFGLDSRFVIAMNARLEQYFPGLPRTVFFEYPSIRAVVAYLLEEYESTLQALFYGDAAPAPAAAAAAPAPAAPAIAVERVAAAGGEGTVDVSDLLALAMDVPLAGGPAAAPQAGDIAIVGVAGRYPKARTLEDLWRNLREGRDCVELLPAERWDADAKGPLVWGGYLEGVAEFDSLFFGLAPRIAETMDPQERLFLEVAWETIENAGYDPLRLARSAEPAPVGVFVGVMYGEYQVLGAELTLLGQPTLVSSSYASTPNRVSYFMNFCGPSMALDTMCSSSLTALHLACASIRAGECKMALVGGTNTTIHPNKYRLLEAGKYLASDGRCRSFGADGDGYVPAEGVGAVLIKPLADARRDGDTVWAVIRGTSVNHGGRARGYTTPNPTAQAAALTRALASAQIAPETLGYVEAHGTGTSLGDPIEIRGLEKALGRLSPKIPIGSIKSNIGHAESAAGIAGLTKVLLQLRAKELVPSIHGQPPNPNIDFARAPVYVQERSEPWARKRVGGAEIPRRALISAFGAGGSNAQVIVEEAEVAPLPRALEAAPRRFTMSARSPERLRAYAQSFLDYLTRLPPRGEAEARELLYDMCATLHFGRTPFDARLTFEVESLRALQQRLAVWLRDPAAAPTPAGDARDDASLFPHPWRRVPLPTYPFERNRLWPTARLHGLAAASPRATVEASAAPAAVAAPASPTVAPALPAVDPAAAVEATVRELVSNLLRIPPEDIKSDAALFDYGLESVAAVELAERINAHLGADITPTIFFEFKTLALFSRHLVDRYGIGAPAAGAAPPVRTSPAPAPRAPAPPAPAPAASSGAPSIEELWRAAAAPAARARKVDLHVVRGEGGRAVEYALLGEGPPLLVFGGLLATHDALTLSEDILSLADDHRVLMVHPPGAGKSELPEGELSLDFIVRQAERAREAAGVSPVAVLGYSFGGIVAQAYVASFARHVDKVILACTTSDPASVTQGMDLVAEEAARHPDGYRALKAADMRKFPLYAKLVGTITPEALAYPAVPTLLVAGALDRYVPATHAERLARARPDAAVHVIDGAGHFLALSHGDVLVARLREFLRARPSAPPRAARPPAPRGPLHPIARESLRAVKTYMEEGETSSGADISPVAAQVGFLVNALLGAAAPASCFFLPSGIEAIDAALRYGRRRAKRVAAPRALVFDPDGELQRHFEFLPGETLSPDLVFAEDAPELRARLDADASIATVYATSACDAATLDAVIAVCAARGGTSILAERHADQGELVTPGLRHAPDLVVFDEALAGFEIHFGVCAIRGFERNGVWTRQPDEFAVRLPGSMMGPALTIARENVLRRFKGALPADTAATLKSFVVDQRATREAHRKWVNPALLESLQAFGLATRQRHADRRGYEIEREDGTSARVTNLYLITSASFRGHTGPEIARSVLAPHDAAHDYAADLARRAPLVTGFARVFPACSPATAVETALKLGLLAAKKGTRLLVLEGSPVFTKVGALVSPVRPGTPLEALVEPCGWPRVTGVDPFAKDAVARIDAAFAEGDVGLVWLETLQSDWGALQQVPPAVLEALARHRAHTGCLVGVDETYTSVGCGRLFHWEGLMDRPDVVATCVGWTDGQLIAGYALTTDAVAAAARARSGAVVTALETTARCALTAHATLTFFDVLEKERVLASVTSTSARFSADLRALAAESPLIARVWGEGLFWAVELDLGKWPRFVRDWFSSFVWSECMRDPAAPVALSMQPLTPACLRVEPRCDMPDAEIDAAIGTLRRVLAKGVDGIVRSVAGDLERRGDVRRAALFRNVLEGFKTP